MKKLITLMASALSFGAATGSFAASGAVTPPAINLDAIAWQQAMQDTSSRALVEFLIKHPNSEFAEQARLMLISGVVAPQPALRTDDLYTDMLQNI